MASESGTRVPLRSTRDLQLPISGDHLKTLTQMDSIHHGHSKQLSTVFATPGTLHYIHVIVMVTYSRSYMDSRLRLSSTKRMHTSIAPRRRTNRAESYQTDFERRRSSIPSQIKHSSNQHPLEPQAANHPRGHLPHWIRTSW